MMGISNRHLSVAFNEDKKGHWRTSKLWFPKEIAKGYRFEGLIKLKFDMR